MSQAPSSGERAPSSRSATPQKYKAQHLVASTKGQSPRSKGSDSALKNVLAKLVKSPRASSLPKQATPEARPLLPQGASTPRKAHASPGRGALGTSGRGHPPQGRGRGGLAASTLSDMLKSRPRSNSGRSARSASLTSQGSRRSVTHVISPPPPGTARKPAGSAALAVLSAVSPNPKKALPHPPQPHGGPHPPHPPLPHEGPHRDEMKEERHHEVVPTQRDEERRKLEEQQSEKLKHDKEQQQREKQELERQHQELERQQGEIEKQKQELEQQKQEQLLMKKREQERVVLEQLARQKEAEAQQELERERQEQRMKQEQLKQEQLKQEQLKRDQVSALNEVQKAPSLIDPPQAPTLPVTQLMSHGMQPKASASQSVTEPPSDSTQSPKSEGTPVMLDLDMISPLSQNSALQPKSSVEPSARAAAPEPTPPPRQDAGSAQTIPLTNLNGREFGRPPHAEKDMCSSPAATDELVMSPSNAATSREREDQRLELQMELNAKNLEIMKLERKLSQADKPPRAPRTDTPLAMLPRYAPQAEVEAESVPRVSEHEDVVPPPMSPLQQEPLPTSSAFIIPHAPSSQEQTPAPRPPPVPTSADSELTVSTADDTPKSARRTLSPALKEVTEIRENLKDLTDELARFKKRQAESPRRTVVLNEQNLAQASKQADQGIQEALTLFGEALKKMSKGQDEKGDFEALQHLQGSDRGEIELQERHQRTVHTQEDCHGKEVIWLVMREGRLRAQHESVEENTSNALFAAMKEMLGFLDHRLNDSTLSSVLLTPVALPASAPVNVELPPLLQEWQENCLKDLLVVHVTSLSNQEFTGRVAIEASQDVERDEITAQVMMQAEARRRGFIESEEVRDIVCVLSPIRTRPPIVTPPCFDDGQVFSRFIDPNPLPHEDIAGYPPSPNIVIAKLPAPDRGIKTPAPKHTPLPVASPDMEIFTERSALFDGYKDTRRTPKVTPSVPPLSPATRSPTSIMNMSSSSMASQPKHVPFTASPAPRVPVDTRVQPPVSELVNISPPRSRSGTQMSSQHAKQPAKELAVRDKQQPNSVPVRTPVRRLYSEREGRGTRQFPSRPPPPPPDTSPELDFEMRRKSISATKSRMKSLYKVR